MKMEIIPLSEDITRLPRFVGRDLQKTCITHLHKILFPRDYSKRFPKNVEHKKRGFIFLCVLCSALD